MRRALVKSKAGSRFCRSCLAVFTIALLVLVSYVYHEGLWRDIFHFYKYFFDIKNLEVYLASLGYWEIPVFILLQVLQVVFAPIPGEVTGFVGGYLFGNVWGAFFSTIGLVTGSILAFYIARTLGIRFVERVVKKTFIDKFNSFVTHKGLYITFILFLLPGFPKDSLCYLLGLTHMRIVDFILINLIGRLPGTIMLTIQGSAVKEGQYVSFFIILVISVLLTGLLYVIREFAVQWMSRMLNNLINRNRNPGTRMDTK